MAIAEVSTWDRERYTTNGAPYGTLHSTHTKEQYSIAFVHALATRARCKVEHINVDDEQVDLTIKQKARHLHYSRVQVDVQMKCTARDLIHEDGMHFPIPRHQYDGLREPSIVSKILVGLAVDPEFDNWMAFTPDNLLMRGTAYWRATDDLPAISTQSATVILPDSNRFNVDQLLDMLQRIAGGGKP